jgi:hypothetical protein
MRSNVDCCTFILFELLASILHCRALKWLFAVLINSWMEQVSELVEHSLAVEANIGEC